jgi:hypothetical protein
MHGFELPAEFLNMLLGGNRHDCHTCEDVQKVDILQLDHNEMEEYASITAERDRIVAELKKIQLDQEANDTRKKLFWLNLEKKHGFGDDNHNLRIVNNQTVVAANCKLDACKHKPKMPPAPPSDPG